MWTCSKCGEQLEATFDTCWSCGARRDGVSNPDFQKEAEADINPSSEPEDFVDAVERVAAVDPIFPVAPPSPPERVSPDEPVFAAEPVFDAEPIFESEDVFATVVNEYQAPVQRRSCRACGSTRIIPNVELLDHDNKHLYALVCGNPEAVLFKDRLFSQVRAWICGMCGVMELRVVDPASLYEKYCDSKDKQT